MLAIHCICHTLALACADANESLKPIRNAETILRQLWQYFENSPKRTAQFLKIQLAVRGLHVPEKQLTNVGRKLKKACRTRWLSFDSAVQAILRDFEAVLQTLAVFEEENATACGLFRKLQSLELIGTFYVLRSILPILTKLSKSFQKDVVSFSQVKCQIKVAKKELAEVSGKKTPLHQLQADLDSFVNISPEIKANKSTEVRLETLLQSYTSSLSSSLDARFSGCLAVVGAFSLFDPSAIPGKSNEEFLHYGKEMVATLGEHYCPMEEPNMFGVSPSLFKD